MAQLTYNKKTGAVTIFGKGTVSESQARAANKAVGAVIVERNGQSIVASDNSNQKVVVALDNSNQKVNTPPKIISITNDGGKAQPVQDTKLQLGFENNLQASSKPSSAFQLPTPTQISSYLLGGIKKAYSGVFKTQAIIGGGIAAATIAPATTYGTAKVVAYGLAASKITQAAVIGKIKPTQFQKELMKTTEFKEAKSAGQAADIAGESTPAKIGKDVFAIARLSKKDTAQFTEGVSEYYKTKGYGGEKLSQAVKISLTERKAKALGETAGLVAISTASEAMGQKLVTKAASKGITVTGKGQVLKTSVAIGKEIAKAGFAEGVATDLLLQGTRGFKSDPKRTLISGTIGAVSAGTIGGLIAGTAAKKPAISKALLGAAYVTDPFEPTGDILEAVGRKIGSKITRIPVVTPTITLTPTYTTISTETKTPKVKSPTFIKNPIKTPTRITNVPSIASLTTVKSPITTKTSTITATKTSVPVYSSIFTPVSTPVPTAIFTPVSTLVTTPVNIPIKTPVLTSIFTPVSTPVSAPVTIVIPTPKLPIIPPILPSGGGGGGLFRFGKRGFRTTRYLPSLLGLKSKGTKKLPGFLTGLEIRKVVY